VGGGIIVGGRLLLGANHAAGELGHTAIFGNGLPCRCGATGCVERYVGSAWVVDRARKRIRAQLKRRTVHRNQTALFAGIAPVGTSIMHDMVKGDLKELTTREIGRAARKGDRLALALVEETGNYLGLALASAVQLVDPERVIIGGGVARMGAPLLRAVRRTMSRQVMMFPGRRLDVVLSRLSSDAGIVGAACFRLAAARFSR
jgi:glucokinase